ncbi:Slp family lipoprotein [Nitrosococcus watsonii]|uniref:Outer membrane lipoprotein Slp n=1 Tax=Nitrosococcus watsoni (strain C-113) TaxID=105559 RepID=D8K685_NITWC|nr:Slp/YeaY family lipoprotein [Nitrosococcus watsonii]ADJ28412.1 outer membrane lipoprotein Slp [Nitrosococcus watsonii C-113]
MQESCCSIDKIVLTIIFFVLGGCASQFPPLVQQPLLGSPSLSAVREDIAYYQGSYVRWGGTIAGIQNKKEHTIIEIIARPLESDSRPREIHVELGRFLAWVDGFLDPEIYRPGRDMTVYGSIEKLIKKGEEKPLLPLLQVKKYHLWKPRNYPPAYYPYPYWKPRGYY